MKNSINSSLLKKVFTFSIMLSILTAFIISGRAYGQNWSSLGTGNNGHSRALTVYNGQLIVGGDFTTAGGISANHVAAWNGTSWSALGSPTNGVNGSVYALYVYNNMLYAGGIFTTAGGIPANHIAMWNGTSWSALGQGTNDTVYTINSFHNAIIAGGAFTLVGSLDCKRIAVWNNIAWFPLGIGAANGVNAAVLCLDRYNNQLVAGGRFTTAAGTTVNRIAQWSGSAWSPVGSGIDNGAVAVLYQYSNVLIVGGNYTSINGVTFGHIAQWNGTSYTPMSVGVNGAGLVNSIRPFNGTLFVGGDFPNAGGVLVNNIASWNGTVWASLLGGLESGGSMVDAITLYHGLITVAGGFITTNTGMTVNNVAAWGAAPTTAPTLITPTNTSVIYTRTPLLRWTTVFWSGKYNVQISTSASFNTILINDSTTTDLDTTYTVPSGVLQNNTQYFWRAAGINPRGRGPFSAVWSFNVGNVPAAPVLLTPPDSSTVPNMTPTLTWNPVANIDYYGLQVSSSSTFNTMIINDSLITSTNYTVSSGLLQQGVKYYWRAFGSNSLGRGPNSSTWNFLVMGLTGISHNGSEIPKEYNLYQNFPNPFNPSTTIKFDIPQNSGVRLLVYDMLGRQVQSLVDGELKAGKYQVSWNAANLASGIYYYKLESGPQVFIKKLILLK